MNNIVSLQDARLGIQQRKYKKHLRSLDNQSLEVEVDKIISMDRFALERGIDMMDELTDRTVMDISEKIRHLRDKIENSLSKL